MSEQRLGLVLAGGGAKGAYALGVLEYLAQQRIVPTAISGTSIGALNGAVVAAAHTFEEGVEALAIVWQTIAQSVNNELVERAQELDKTSNKTRASFGILRLLDHSVLTVEFIEKVLRQCVSLNLLAKGIDLWVAVFPSIKGIPTDWGGIVDLGASRLGVQPVYFHVQDLIPKGLAYNALLASAALPVILPSHRIDNMSYRDGGLGDNVPFKPLVQEVKCTHVIVIHLKDGPTWNRHKFPEQQIIEICPYISLNNVGGRTLGMLESLINFSSQRIGELRDLGFADAKRSLMEINSFLRTMRAHRSSVNRVQQAIYRMKRYGDSH